MSRGDPGGAQLLPRGAASALRCLLHLVNDDVRFSSLVCLNMKVSLCLSRYPRGGGGGGAGHVHQRPSPRSPLQNQRSTSEDGGGAHGEGAGGSQ